MKGFNYMAVRKNFGAVDRLELMGGGRLQELVAMEVYSNCRPVGRGVIGPHPPQTPEVHFFLLTNPSLLFYSLHFSRSSFFADQKLHRNTYYAGYLHKPLMGSFKLQEGDLRSFFS